MINLKKDYASDEQSENANLNLDEAAEHFGGDMHTKMMAIAISLGHHAAQFINVGEELAPIIHAVDREGRHFVVPVAELFSGEKTAQEIGDVLRELMKAADVRYFVMAQEVYMTLLAKRQGDHEITKEEALKEYREAKEHGDDLEREEAVILRGEADDGSLLFAALKIENDGINKTLIMSPPAFLERSRRDDGSESHTVLVNNYGYLLEVNDAVIH